MGICGHMGVLFDPSDESAAISAVTGAGTNDDEEWCKDHAAYGVNDEDWSEIQTVLLKVAASDPTLAPVALAMTGNRSIGEGPGSDFFLYRPDDILEMAFAFGRVSEVTLDAAISAAASEHEWDYPDEFYAHLKDRFRKIGTELNRIAENGWAMIGFLF